MPHSRKRRPTPEQLLPTPKKDSPLQMMMETRNGPEDKRYPCHSTHTPISIIIDSCHPFPLRSPSLLHDTFDYLFWSGTIRGQLRSISFKLTLQTPDLLHYSRIRRVGRCYTTVAGAFARSFGGPSPLRGAEDGGAEAFAGLSLSPTRFQTRVEEQKRQREARRRRAPSTKRKGRSRQCSGRALTKVNIVGGPFP